MKKILLLLLIISSTASAQRFWVGGTGSWSQTAHWSLTSGGAGGASVPSATDNVTFDGASNATAYTVTVDVAATMLNFTLGAPGTSGKVTWAGTSTMAISGNMDLNGGTAGITKSTNTPITFNSTTGTKTIRCYGVSVASQTIFNGSGGTWQLLDAYSTTRQFTLTAGTVDMNGFNVTAGSWSTAASTAFSQGAGTITVGNARIAGTVLTMNTTCTYSFSSGAQIVFNIAAANSISVNGAMTWPNIYLKKNSTANPTATISVSANGNQTFSDFKIDGDVTVAFTGNVNRKIVCSTFTALSSAGNIITLVTTGTPTNVHYLVCTGGRVCADYMNIQHSIATPDYIWYAGANSTNNQATATAGSGWIFTPCPKGDFFKMF